MGEPPSSRGSSQCSTSVDSVMSVTSNGPKGAEGGSAGGKYNKNSCKQHYNIRNITEVGRFYLENNFYFEVSKYHMKNIAFWATKLTDEITK